MVRRISLVRKRPDLTREQFAARWLGEHAQLARRLEGLRSYTIDFLDGEDPPYDGIAITCFDSREAAERAFADAELAAGLLRTREEFAASVEVRFTTEHVVFDKGAATGTTTTDRLV